ncbi:MAG: OmcA/MtrC family decaheme c-type cytochrome [Myxococcales bacterium]|nr:OmcA/MtrC family decaheme c-type cytochrome [Myxococcales bacterium]
MENVQLDGDQVSVDILTADADGRPVDRNGFFTEGRVSVNYVLAFLEESPAGDPQFYTAYTTRTQTSPITNVTATQASAESNGAYERLGAGRYRYTFMAQIDAATNASKTHVIAAYATRTVDGVRAVSNVEIDFVPDGSNIKTRELVTEDACNACHMGLEAHGGSRQNLKLCFTCHSPQTPDPDTGNTTDMRVMIHKIHMGAMLPSVQGGEPYQIIGFNQTVHDYSEVVFVHEVNRCESCHDGADAAFALVTKTDGCVSCHDGLPALTPTQHPDLSNEGTCAVCHSAQSSIAPITAATHNTGFLDASRPTIAFEVVAVSDTGPGQTPRVRFRLEENGAPRDYLARPLNTLRVTFAGPNPDYQEYWQSTVTTVNTVAVDAANGVFEHTASTPIPASATGSYTVALEGYDRDAANLRVPGFSELFFIAVTDAVASARPDVADNDECNDCHANLAAHGFQRQNVTYCSTCHNPNNPGNDRFARLEGPELVLIPTVDMKVMTHKIHMGASLPSVRAGTPYVLGGNPSPTVSNPAGNPVDFSHVIYPGEISMCEGCHGDGNYALPPVVARRPVVMEWRQCTEDPSADADDFCTGDAWEVVDTMLIPPATAACTSCHDSLDAIAHAELNTTSDGREACATCHGPGSTWDVEAVHR